MSYKLSRRAVFQRLRLANLVMPAIKKWGVTKRAIFLGVAPASAIAVLLGFCFTTDRFEELEQALAERGGAIARQLAPSAAPRVLSGDSETLQHLAQTALQETDVTAVTISDPNNKVLAQSGKTSSGSGKASQFTVPILQTPLDEVSQSGAEREKTLGFVMVEISRESLLKKKNHVLTETLVITVLGLSMAWIMAVRMARGITQPIMQVAGTVEKFGGGELAVRAETGSGGALGVLQAEVNKMAAALHSAQTELEQRVREATAQLSEKKAEADRANLAKSRFLAAASHDLRQPVHALGLFAAELGAKNLAPDDRKIVENIEAGVLALSDMLDSMLDVSKLDAGALPANISDFRVSGLLRRMEAELGPAAREKGLRFKVVMSRAVVRSDPLLLQRIILNLVANAVRYTNRGRIVVGCRRRRGGLSIQVWDTGIGIPESRQKYIFQEFYQLGNPERDRRKGLGLGLAIVDRLARLLNHQIGLTSTPGKGSLFAVDVPLGDAALVYEPAPPARAVTQLDRALLAIVEDDDLVRASMQGLVRKWGCDAVFADSGAELVRELAGRTPDLLVCDYRLPAGETGIEAISRVREACAKKVPAMLISGDTSSKLVEVAESAGYPLLHKPVRPAKLRALLTHLLVNR